MNKYMIALMSALCLVYRADAGGHAVAGDSGGRSAASAAYSMQTSLGAVGCVAGSDSYRMVGACQPLQPSVTNWSISIAEAMPERSDVSLSGVAWLDDDSHFAVSGSEITWDAAQNPVEGISAAGLAILGSVIDDTPAVISGKYLGVSREAGLKVINKDFVTVTVNPGFAGGQAVPEGTFTVPQGSSFTASLTEAQVVPVRDPLEQREMYLCTGWNGTGSAPTCTNASGSEYHVTFTADADSTLEWNWKRLVWMDIQSGNGGRAIPPGWQIDANGQYAPPQSWEPWYGTGELCEVATAIPLEGYHFVSWSGAVASTNNPLRMVLTRPATVVANFDLNTYGITALCGPNGSISPAPVSVPHGGGTSVTIKPDAGYVLAALLVDGKPVTPVSVYTFTNVTAAHTIKAEFRLAQYQLSTGVTPAHGHLDVTNGWYNTGTVVTVTATADEGYAFAGWGWPQITSTAIPLRVTMNQPQTVIAVFVPTTTYVSPDYSEGNAGGYTFGDNAFNVIQDAVDAVVSNGTVLVNDGIYETGGYVINGMATRVVAHKPVAIRSVNGSGRTHIMGEADFTNATRGVYLCSGSSISGFTVTESFTYYSANRNTGNGGGIYAQGNCSISNCVIEFCMATVGGGVYIAGSGCVMRNCLVDNCVGFSSCGGVYAVPGSVLENCTITRNQGWYSTGGVYAQGSTVRNSIIWSNLVVMPSTAPTYPQYYSSGSTFSYCDTIPLPPGTGNRAVDPQFISPAFGNFALSGTSPCLDAGLNAAWMTGATDAAGNPRLVDGDDDGSAVVDIGAFEARTAPCLTITANGFTEPLDVNQGDEVVIQITENRGKGRANQNWWIVCLTPDGSWISYDLVRNQWTPGASASKGPFAASLAPTVVLDTTSLASGKYTFYFATSETKASVWNVTGNIACESVTVTVH